MAALVTCALYALILLKPWEFTPSLEGLPIVHVLFGVAVLVTALDALHARVRPAMAPHVPLFLAFAVWALLVTLIKQPSIVAEQLSAFGILSCVFLTASVALASARGLALFAATFLACALIAISTAIAQYRSPRECFLGDPEWQTNDLFVPDGRPCEVYVDCKRPSLTGVPERYICERAGPFQTSTIGDRVRFRGGLRDPNDLSLMITAALPFGLAFAEAERRRRRGEAAGGPSSNKLRLLPASALLGATGFTVVAAKSRTGLIAYLIVTAVYLIRRVGAWGVITSLVVAPLMLLYGGRSGDEADLSADERTDLLREAFELLYRTKGIGLGAGQFPLESARGMTAHNAYLLAAAETGIVGLLLFGTMLYLGLKVPFALWFGDYRLRPTTARIAPALAVSLSGVAVGIVFLSWTYKDILYMLLGASAALYGVAKAEDPRVVVRLSQREMVLVPVGILWMLLVMYIGARLRG